MRTTTYIRTGDAGVDTMIVTVDGDEARIAYLTDGEETARDPHMDASRLPGYLVDMESEGYRLTSEAQQRERKSAMSVYQCQISAEHVGFLTDPGGTLDQLADHVRDGDERGLTGYLLDNQAMAALRGLTPDDDGSVTEADGDHPAQIWFGGVGYPLTLVSQS